MPLATEQYCLALRHDHLHDARVIALIDYLGSAACGELITRLPGYSATHSGEVATVDDVLPALPPAKARTPARRRKTS